MKRRHLASRTTFQTHLFESPSQVPRWKTLPPKVKHEVLSNLTRLIRNHHSKSKNFSSRKDSDER